MRKILLICVVVQVLLGAIASRTYLIRHNTLHANGRWESSKTRLERGLMGSFAFVSERQSLAGGVLNLGAWHGFQEIVHHEPVGAIETIEFDLRLDKGGYVVALFDRDAQGGASGLRLSASPRHPNAFLGIAPDGKFLSKQPLAERSVEPEAWLRARIDFGAESVSVRLGDRELGAFDRKALAGGSFGFRGGGRSAFVDNIDVTLEGGAVVSENFDTAGNVFGLTLAVSAFLVVLNLGLYAMLARLTRSDEKILAFSFLLANLTVLAIGVVLFAFVLLRAGAYPGLGRALEEAEASFRRGTAEQVVADIKGRHPLHAEDGTFRILFLGTSQTWGAGARRDSESFVSRVEELLNAAEATDVRFECINGGFSSLKAADLVPLLEQELLAYEPDLMFVNLGTNDRGTRRGFASSVGRMVQAAERGGARVVLIKEANEQGSMDRGQLARFSDLDRVGGELGSPVVDMHSHLLGLQDTGFLWWDLVHLTSYGQRLAAEKLVEEMGRLGVPESPKTAN